jgi:hypothetical protein
MTNIMIVSIAMGIFKEIKAKKGTNYGILLDKT